MAIQQLQAVAAVCMLTLSFANAAGVDRGVENQISLYQALRNFALPDVRNAFGDATPVTQRFILQIPGKVLNPVDYDPGDAYREALANPDDGKPEVNIPPRISENMFYLADTSPALNPIGAGETGKSFSEYYETTVGAMDVKGFDQLTQVLQARYKSALAVLSALQPDPENRDLQISLTDLYSRYQQRYNEQQLKMEDLIYAMQQNNSALDYEFWFQRNYPILNAQVEGEYTRWLLHGQKDLVESYKAHVDVVSSGAELQKAKSSLRSAGVISLDRSRTIYPVSFFPSNFYQYLYARASPLTQDQINVRIGDLESRKRMLEVTLTQDTSSADIVTYLQSVEDQSTKASTDLGTSTDNLQDQLVKCRSDQLGLEDGAASPESCQALIGKTENLVKSLQTDAEATTEKEGAQNEFGAESTSKAQIQAIVDNMDAQISDYRTQLKDAPVGTPDYIAQANGTHELTADEMESQWTSFEFDSTDAETKVDSKSTSYQASLSFGASGLLWSVSGGASYSRSESDFSKHVSNTNVKISAKFLRVKINRPWFRASIFDNAELTVRRQGTLISPGYLDETTFFRTVTSPTTTYLLPQYAIAFLLAKDVSMQFSGMEENVRRSALSESASAQVSGHYGPFSASGSFAYANQETHLQASSTADGLRITIPGAQIIGYYVDVIPIFPKP